jgi:chaperonin GroEL
VPAATPQLEPPGTEGAIVVETVRSNDNPNVGYNASTDKYEDLIAAGVIDPTKVTRTALQNAASIGASLMLTTEAMVRGDSREETCRGPRWGPEGMDY